MPRHLALEALVGGATVTAAAEAAGVGRSTLNRWLKEPEFAAALSQAKRAHLEEIQAALRGLAANAIAVLGNTLASSLTLDRHRADLALKILNALGAARSQPLGREPDEAPAGHTNPEGRAAARHSGN